MASRDVTTSKFLSLVLRHRPDQIGIELDESGWTDVQVLLQACAEHGQPITRDDLERIVSTSDKQRFAFNDDRMRIRANQGHSVQVELGYEPAAPPPTLYHGTTQKFVDAIRREGLKKGSRHHVHLSETIQPASAVGTRHGKLVLLEVRAGQMHRDGYRFFKTPNNVWLTDSVPPEYLIFPRASAQEA